MVPLTVQASLSYLEQQHVPVIGGDISDLTWWQSPILYPEGTYAAALIPASLQFLQSKKITKLASYVCTEDPACSQAGTLIQQDASQYGISIVSSGTISIAQPSFSAECEEAQSAQAQAVFVGADGGSVERFGDDCAQQNYKPVYEAAGIAAIDSLADDPNLNGLYFAAQDFSWTDTSLPAEQQYHKAVATYGPGIPTGAPTSDAWASAILATVAASQLSATDPTSAQFIAGLDSIKNNTLGGLAPPLTFNAGADAGQSDCFFNMQVTQGQWLDPNGATPQCLP
jgi:branched-chain amino acid transport system substrate-binding protein